jgi:hypothetical protein
MLTASAAGGPAALSVLDLKGDGSWEQLELVIATAPSAAAAAAAPASEQHAAPCAILLQQLDVTPEVALLLPVHWPTSTAACNAAKQEEHQQQQPDAQGFGSAIYCAVSWVLFDPSGTYEAVYDHLASGGFLIIRFAMSCLHDFELSHCDVMQGLHSGLR